jgi:hypothetical protein
MFVFALVGLAILLEKKNQAAPFTYYVQLIRGTEDDKPPLPGCRKVGPKLTGIFQSSLKWKDYWQIKLKEVALPPGHRTRVRLNNHREVEIDLSNPNLSKVTVFQDGKVVSRTISPMGQGSTLIGGDRNQNSAWFIVASRDTPAMEK